MIQEKKVRIVVTQGYCFLRNTLTDRLEKESWIEVCAETSGIEETRELIDLYQPHVLVINISMKCSAGVSSLKKLKCDYSGLAIIALSCDSEFENLYAGQALRAGADGYISSVDSLENLVGAIRSAREGVRFMSRRTELHHRKSAAGEKVLDGLSRRESEVFCLTGCGYVPQRIAEKMDISVKTVESYRERIRKKMHLLSGADLLYFSVSFMRSAARRGIKEADDLVVRELLSATD